jgi:Kef-type K+ transport system membrane component KefB
MMLVNGGAAVALLAFLGNLATRSGSSANIIAFAGSMHIFVIGVFLAAVAYATTYFSQLFYGGEKKWQQRTGLGFHIVTGLVGASSLIAFLWGAHAAYQAFVAFDP